jgi:hypothetical protein
VELPSPTLRFYDIEENISMRNSIIIALAGLIHLSAGGNAIAQMSIDGYRQPSRAGYSTQRGRDMTVDGRACIKLCPNDMLPCDPIYFKTADLRCFDGRKGR